ncbi:MAG: hypothetical protein C0501_16140 [Isosphaera sp.]|nr:hypothetical protein [Isosphaera sp.]
MRAVLGCAAVLALAAGVAVSGQAPVDAKKLVGKWEPAPEGEPEKKDKKDKKDEKKDKPPPGPAMVLEFAADPKLPGEGTVSLTVTTGGKEDRAGGRYKVEGDKLNVTLRLGEKEVKETLTVKALTDAALETEDSRGKTEKFRRKK